MTPNKGCLYVYISSVTLLKRLASEGLRTLVFACKVILPEEYQQWNNNYYQPASTSLQNRKELIAKAAEYIEKDLQLIGISGIEDRLQDGVNETIQKLYKAGIILWVLTGDKVETAINIGYSSAVLNPSTTYVIEAC